MRFRRGARLDTGEVSDRRGERGTALGNDARRRGRDRRADHCVGVRVRWLRRRRVGQRLRRAARPDNADLENTCKTGADANQRDRLPHRRRRQLGPGVLGRDARRLPQPADTVLFTGQTSTGCGGASSAVGPFYCPADEQVYIDLGFYDELHDRFGAQRRAVRGGLRDRARVRPPRARPARHDGASGGATAGRESGSVRLELQADCYAGVWAAHAVRDAVHRETSPRPTSPTGSTRRPRWETTGYNSAATGPRRPGVMDARLRATASALVLERIRLRRPGRVQHVLRAVVVNAAAAAASRTGGGGIRATTARFVVEGQRRRR